MEKKRISLFWFRRDLRTNDNHGLYQALKNSENVLPIFIFDTDILEKLPNKEDKRLCFIYDCVKELHAYFTNEGSSLLVLHGNPLILFSKLTEEYTVEGVYTNDDYEPYARQRDDKIKKYLAEKKIPFLAYKDQVIFEKNEIIKADGSPYTIFTPFSKLWKNTLTATQTASYPSASFMHKLFQTQPTPLLPFHQLGFNYIETKVPSKSVSTAIVSTYDKTRNFPWQRGTTGISVHLRFGTISVREMVKIALQYNETWLNELIWREFFMQILYHYPSVVQQSFKPKYDQIVWRNNEKEFAAWCKGETGYGMVDAGMHELNETGWMHNRVRMVVASFLCKHLLIDWRWGETYFAEKLMDYDLSANNGNWQWAAGTGCDSAPYFRIFNPYEQQKKFDSDFKYIKKWIPKYDAEKYISPIVDHSEARKRALEIYGRGISGG